MMTALLTLCAFVALGAAGGGHLLYGPHIYGGGQHYGGQGVYGSKEGLSVGGHNYGTQGKKKQGFADFGGDQGGVYGQTGFGGRGRYGGSLGNAFVKDRGHKRYGSKKVQHKEEYDDQQSYHDVYRDKDLKKKFSDYDKKFKNAGGKKFKTHGGSDYFKGGRFGDKYGRHGLSSHKDAYGTRYQKGGRQYGGKKSYPINKAFY